MDRSRICLQDFYASTSHANNVSERFLVGRGARQGDPFPGVLNGPSNDRFITTNGPFFNGPLNDRYVIKELTTENGR